MKNNILGALVIFFAVVACLLIIDDLTYSGESQLNYPTQKELAKVKTDTENLATTDLETED
ncbi:hypothetical protein Q2T40_17340 [Winogradskyella maritima]|uniref:Uncharacterized protein n=1 Tax=Winogradskyella maritima TaxID=1517766 RepID=A0ABV8AFP4_9FLAO|nr:hypothetical protein [Winogradskyella maritima]